MSNYSQNHFLRSSHKVLLLLLTATVTNVHGAFSFDNWIQEIKKEDVFSFECSLGTFSVSMHEHVYYSGGEAVSLNYGKDVNLTLSEENLFMLTNVSAIVAKSTRCYDPDFYLMQGSRKAAFGRILGGDGKNLWGYCCLTMDGIHNTPCPFPCGTFSDEEIVAFFSCSNGDVVRSKRNALVTAYSELDSNVSMVPLEEDNKAKKASAKGKGRSNNVGKDFLRKMSGNITSDVIKARDELMSSMVTNFNWAVMRMDDLSREQKQAIIAGNNNLMARMTGVSQQLTDLTRGMERSEIRNDLLNTNVNQLLTMMTELDHTASERASSDMMQGVLRKLQDGHDCDERAYKDIHQCTCDSRSSDLEFTPQIIRRGYGIGLLSCKKGVESFGELVFRDHRKLSSSYHWGPMGYMLSVDVLRHQEMLLKSWEDLGKPPGTPCELMCFGVQSASPTADKIQMANDTWLYYQETCQCVPNTLDCEVKIEERFNKILISLKSKNGLYRITSDGITEAGFVEGTFFREKEHIKPGKRAFIVECNMNIKRFISIVSLKEFCSAKYPNDYQAPLRVYCKNSSIIVHDVFYILAVLMVLVFSKLFSRLLGFILAFPLGLVQAAFLNCLICPVCRVNKGFRCKRHVHFKRCIFCGETVLPDGHVRYEKARDLYLYHRGSLCVSFAKTNRVIQGTMASYNLVKWAVLTLAKPVCLVALIYLFMGTMARVEAIDLRQFDQGSNSSLLLSLAMVTGQNGSIRMTETRNHQVNQSATNKDDTCAYPGSNILCLLLGLMTITFVAAMNGLLGSVKYCSICQKSNGTVLKNKNGYKIMMCRLCVTSDLGEDLISTFYEDELEAVCSDVYKATTENIYSNIEGDSFDSESQNDSEDKNEIKTKKKSRKATKNRLSKKHALGGRKFKNPNSGIESIRHLNQCHSLSSMLGQAKISMRKMKSAMFIMIISSALFRPVWCLDDIEKVLANAGFVKDSSIKFHKTDARTSEGFTTKDYICTETECSMRNQLNTLIEVDPGWQAGYYFYNQSIMDNGMEFDMRVVESGKMCNYVDQYETYHTTIKQITGATCTEDCSKCMDELKLTPGLLYSNVTLPSDSDWACNGFCFAMNTGCTCGSCWAEKTPNSEVIKVKQAVKGIDYFKLCYSMGGSTYCRVVTQSVTEEGFKLRKVSSGNVECPSLIAVRPGGEVLTGAINSLGEFSGKFGSVQEVNGVMHYREDVKYRRECKTGYVRKIIYEKCHLDTWFLYPTLVVSSLHKVEGTQNGYKLNSMGFGGTYSLMMDVPTITTKKKGFKLKITNLKIEDCSGCSDCRQGAHCNLLIESENEGILVVGSETCKLKQQSLQVESIRRSYQVGVFCDSESVNLELHTVNSENHKSDKKILSLHKGEKLELGSQAMALSEPALVREGCMTLFCSFSFPGSDYLSYVFYLAMILVVAPVLLLIVYSLKTVVGFFFAAGKKVL